MCPGVRAAGPRDDPSWRELTALGDFRLDGHRANALPPKPHDSADAPTNAPGAACSVQRLPRARQASQGICRGRMLAALDKVSMGAFLRGQGPHPE